MSCRTCEMTARQDRGEAPLWDSIVRTPHWDLAHAYDTSHEGWLVLAHVHVHLIARPDDLPKHHRGPGIFSLLGVPTFSRVPEERMDEISLVVREQLNGRPG